MNWEHILSGCRKYNCYPSIEEFFSTCPILIRNYLTPCTFAEGQILIEAGAPCGTVYILISGRLQAIEEKAGEVPYSFFDIIPSVPSWCPCRGYFHSSQYSTPWAS